jgi:hypothetical protein
MTWANGSMRNSEIIGGRPSRQPNVKAGDRIKKECMEETEVFSQSASVALHAALMGVCCVAPVRNSPISTSA